MGNQFWLLCLEICATFTVWTSIENQCAGGMSPCNVQIRSDETVDPSSAHITREANISMRRQHKLLPGWMMKARLYKLSFAILPASRAIESRWFYFVIYNLIATMLYRYKSSREAMLLNWIPHWIGDKMRTVLVTLRTCRLYGMLRAECGCNAKSTSLASNAITLNEHYFEIDIICPYLFSCKFSLIHYDKIKRYRET